MNSAPPISVLPNPRRKPLHPAIDEALIEQVVRAFYTRVREDEFLAPIFAVAIPGDWEPHLKTMMAFWSSVMMMSGRYKGQPVVKHRALTNVTPAHFERWLALFNQTVEEICETDVAALFRERAGSIAVSLQRAMFDADPANQSESAA